MTGAATCPRCSTILVRTDERNDHAGYCDVCGSWKEETDQ